MLLVKPLTMTFGSDLAEWVNTLNMWQLILVCILLLFLISLPILLQKNDNK